MFAPYVKLSHQNAVVCHSPSDFKISLRYYILQTIPVWDFFKTIPLLLMFLLKEKRFDFWRQLVFKLLLERLIFFDKFLLSKHCLRGTKTFSHSFKNIAPVWNETHEKPGYYFIIKYTGYVWWRKEMQIPLSQAV